MAAETAEALPWLVVTDVDAVQSYVLSSIRLSTIAGASQIVAANDRDVAALAKKPEYGGEAVHSVGGVGVFRFPGKDKADEFAAAAEKRFAKTSVNGTLTASAPVELTAAGTFGAALTAAHADLEVRKRAGHPAPEPPTHPLARPCAFCGRESAASWIERPEGDEWIGPACLAKRAARSRGWLAALRVKEGWSALAEKHLARHFEELAGDGALAVLVADGDDVGRRLAGLATEADYRAFAGGLSEAVRHAVAEAIAAVSPPPAPGRRLPAQVLFQGGDDLALACRGEVALPLALRLVEAFGEKATAGWAGQDRVGLSVGLVLTHPGFPFLTAHRLATRLLAEAKRAARGEGWPEGAVDFALVSESHAEADVLLADREVASATGAASLAFTGRPYCASAAGPRSLGAFRDACRALGRARFPRGKLFDLRALASAGSYDPPARLPLDDGYVAQVDGQFGAALAEWRTRVARSPESLEAWGGAMDRLGAGPDGRFPARNGALRSPVGDLADGLELWGG